jgi:hypothetical protein
MYRCERVLSNYVQMWKSTFKLCTDVKEYFQTIHLRRGWYSEYIGTQKSQ